MSKLIARKEIYRLWFEFYKLALLSDKKEIKSLLKKSAAFYEPWELQGYKEKEDFPHFDDWWIGHKALFMDRDTVQILNPGDAMDEQHIYFAVPKDRAMELIKHEFNELLATALANRSKRRSVTSQRYAPTELQGMKPEVMRMKLDLQKKVFCDESLKGAKLLERVREYFAKERYKRKSKNEIPREFKGDQFVYGDDNALKNCTRYRADCRKIIANVATGVFPGKY